MNNLLGEALLIAPERILDHPLILSILIHELAALLAHQEVEQQMCALRLQETRFAECEKPIVGYVGHQTGRGEQNIACGRQASVRPGAEPVVLNLGGAG